MCTGLYLGPSLILWTSVALGHQHRIASFSSQSRSTTSSISREMLASLPISPAAPPLEDENLLVEILLRLPPLPSSLPRASAVSKRWRGLVSDPRFVRRFRIRHRRNPPLLGCFVYDYRGIHFQPALEAPNRVPQGRFSFPVVNGRHFAPLGCRHGLVLSSDSQNHFLVWDPVKGDQHLLDIPPGFRKYISPAAVLRAAADVPYFEVVLVGTNNMQQAFAYVYSSKTGSWGNLTTVPLPPRDSSGTHTWVDQDTPAVMVGDSLYWFLYGDSSGILGFDLSRRHPGFIPWPEDETVSGAELRDILLIMVEGGGIGLLVLSGYSVQLWKRKTNSDGIASWVLGRSIALDKLLSINSEKGETPYILGFVEGNNSVLLWTCIGNFTVQLESLQFKKVFESESWFKYFPFEGLYAADEGIGGGHDGDELLQNA